jgi:hypothetical protein
MGSREKPPITLGKNVLLRVPATCEILKCSPNHLRKLVRLGVLPAKKIAGRVFFHQDDVAALFRPQSAA